MQHFFPNDENGSLHIKGSTLKAKTYILKWGTRISLKIDLILLYGSYLDKLYNGVPTHETKDLIRISS